MFKRQLTISLIAAIFTSCIGTDIVEDSVSRVEVSSPQEFLTVNESLQMTSVGVNEFGDRFDLHTGWESSNIAVATVDVNGVVFGVARGQVTISATFEGIVSKGVQLNVIDVANEVAYIKLTGPGMRLEVGEAIDLNAFAYKSNDVTIEGIEISWASEAPSVATVDGQGLVTAVANGMTTIIASADGVNSEPYSIIVGGEAGVRTGTFMGSGGHTVSGDVRVSMLDTNSIQVSLQENFSSINGPGLYVYLSNSKSSVEGGVELMPLQSIEGPSSYPAEGVALGDYKFVIIHCKPFNVVFGYAELN